MNLTFKLFLILFLLAAPLNFISAQANDEKRMERVPYEPGIDSTPKVLHPFVRAFNWVFRRKDPVIWCYNKLPQVNSLTLEKSEITACSSDDASCAKVKVLTQASDPENDTLIYDYKISGGKIIGQGSKVIWDLAGVGPGTYSITADVDDGYAMSLKKITEEIRVIGKD
jgi:hypothetical protein